MSVRTRIAPSPTGDPHVGTGYIALFNYCFAKKNGGQFILRIEDTDQVRSTSESETQILDSLKWLGLEWDEGPDIGGPHGPYRQSERSELYAEHAQILLDAGHAFRCFCTAERLTQLRKEQTAAKGFLGYDGHCIGLDPAEVQRRLDAGESSVVRMVVPREGECVLDDYLRGKIRINWAEVDMQVLVKSDGLPTYHLANVVDDHHMRITHVLRGEEWISSAPKHILLYRYFGWEAPVFCHLPLLRNPDKSKLSKRKNPTSILYYERMGFLPEGLVNYLGRMAWSMPDESEKFTLEQMVEHFTLDRISLGGPVFDRAKLSWLNGRWIREELSDEQFADRVAEWALNRDYLMQIIPMIKKRVDRLSDLGPMCAHFLAGRMTLSADLFDFKKLDQDATRQALQWALWQLDQTTPWTSENIEQTLRGTAALLDIKLRLLLGPFFIAMSGKKVSTPLFDTMAVLGRDLSRARVRDAIDALGGVSGKEQKRWKKTFDTAVRAAANPVESTD